MDGNLSYPSKTGLFLQSFKGVIEMLGISLFWLLTGLMVIYFIGIDKIITSLSIEASISKSYENIEDPIIFSVTLLIVTIIWPLIWYEYLISKKY